LNLVIENVRYVNRDYTMVNGHIYVVCIHQEVLIVLVVRKLLYYTITRMSHGMISGVNIGVFASVSMRS
jgi:hypothetical protein